MTVLLSGGSDHEGVRPLIERMCRDLQSAAGAAAPRVGIAAGSDAALTQAVQSAGAAHGIDVVALPASPQTGDVLTLAGLIVGDGDAAQQLMSFGAVISDLRGMIHRGASYLGVGSGAAIAAELALLGGSEIGGIAVAPGHDETEREVELAAGLGFIDLTVLPHAAASGRIGLAVAAIEAELTDRIVGLDDSTALVIGDGSIELLGTGSMWELQQSDDGVIVRTSGATGQ